MHYFHFISPLFTTVTGISACATGMRPNLTDKVSSWLNFVLQFKSLSNADKEAPSYPTNYITFIPSALQREMGLVEVWVKVGQCGWQWSKWELSPQVHAGNITVSQVGSKDNTADILTKPLTHMDFQWLQHQLGVHASLNSGSRWGGDLDQPVKLLQPIITINTIASMPRRSVKGDMWCRVMSQDRMKGPHDGDQEYIVHVWHVIQVPSHFHLLCLRGSRPLY